MLDSSCCLNGHAVSLIGVCRRFGEALGMLAGYAAFYRAGDDWQGRPIDGSEPNEHASASRAFTKH